MDHYTELEARKCPPDLSQDCGIARGCKLVLGTELGRGTLVQEGLFVWAPMEPRREFAAANLQAESYLEREHNARWAALAVAADRSNRKRKRSKITDPLAAISTFPQRMCTAFPHPAPVMVRSAKLRNSASWSFIIFEAASFCEDGPHLVAALGALESASRWASTNVSAA